MKKVISSLIGIITVLTLAFGIQSPAGEQKAPDIAQYAHGDHGG
ncbi:Phr family secreted Rap phosphatase inhibitor [Bacillus thuringiensis]|nr:Phr family secreted Rap phosphatase inhibitor [Bacillus thuringiensis]